MSWPQLGNAFFLTLGGDEDGQMFADMAANNKWDRVCLAAGQRAIRVLFGTTAQGM